MEKYSPSKNRPQGLPEDRSLSPSKGDSQNPSNDRSLSPSKGDSQNPSNDRSLSLSKGIINRKILLWIVTGLFILFMVVIIFFADRGVVPNPIKIMYNYAWGDKLGHFILMGTLTFLVNLSCSARRIQLFSKSVLLGSLLVSIAVIFEELSQLFIPSRSFSGLDLSFDFLGIVCASWLIAKICTPKSDAV